MSVIMGTAGHIDHGKTSLIRALTGIDCDRLGEEKRRGITIELGFAYADLPGGERMGIVDMPGHERFVRTMVAGASGIDFVLLVISADEGVMPQTREHLEICTLLGVRHGIVALTKTDMVDEEMRELAMEDIRDFLKGTFLEGAPIFPVSSVTGEGLDALRAAIVEESRRQPRRRSDLFRLPVDRVFSLKGHGTVVTGTLVSGSAACGDEVELLPSGRRSHIRSIQSHGQGQEKAEAGHRISLNLHGLSVEDVSRGDVVTHVGTMKNSRRWIVELTCLKSSPRGLRHRGEIHFHHSARELAARLYFYDRDRLEPGDTALVEVHFSEPVAGIFGDRCIVRAFSPLRTVAGGSILYPLDTAPRRSHIDAAMQARLLSLPDADDQTRIGVQLELAGRFGATLADLSILTDLSRKSLEKHLQTMSGKGSALCWDKDAKYSEIARRCGWTSSWSARSPPRGPSTRRIRWNTAWPRASFLRAWARAFRPSSRTLHLSGSSVPAASRPKANCSDCRNTRFRWPTISRRSRKPCSRRISTLRSCRPTTRNSLPNSASPRVRRSPYSKFWSRKARW